MENTQNILVGTDFSRASELALDAAAILAKQFGAMVTIAHVFDPTPFAPIAMRDGPGVEQRAVEQEVESRMREHLERLRNEKLSGVPDVKVALVKGTSAAAGICHYAEKEDVDLIVLSTHGHTGLAHLLIGSVAEKVVRHAPCPVLTLRSKAKA